MTSKQTPIRFTEADRSLLNSLKAALDQPSVASLVRHLARAKAREMGLAIPAGEPRTPGRPKNK